MAIPEHGEASSVENLHRPGFVSDTDPAAETGMAAYKWWIEVDGGGAFVALWQRDAANTGWEILVDVAGAPPSGAAGGVLSGTYPDPSFDVSVVTAAGAALLDDATAGDQRTTLGLGTAAVAALDTDTTLAANSDTRVPSQKAIKTYVDGIVTGGASDVMIFKGVVDCSANPNYPAADAGHVYKVSVAGKIGGASGPNVEAGDTLYCITDSTSSGNHATVGANWVIAQVNVDGAATLATKLDDFAAPDDNTDLNVSTSAHGLAPKAPNDALKFLDGTTAYSTPLETFPVAISDETTAITTGTAKVTIHFPYKFTLVEVIAGLSTNGSSSSAFDINKNGTTMLSTVITIDSSEATSLTAATPPVISVSAIAKGDAITFDIDTAGTGAKGAKIYLIGRQVA